MWQSDTSALLVELENQVRSRTGRRVRNLIIEMRPHRVVLHGQTATYYVKQLAQHGIRDVLPQICLENSISVEDTFGGPPRAA
jgi:hypothetical protein